MDAGNLLFPAGHSARQRPEPHLIAARGILRAYEAMRYDAIGLSGNDLTAGYAFFKDKAFNNIPFVSANIFDGAGNHVFKPYIIKTYGSTKTAIIGLTGKTRMSSENLDIRDWRHALEETINAVLPGSDIVIIVLSSLSKDENISLLEHFPMVDIAITSISGSTNRPVQIADRTLVAQSGNRGKYLGRLDIEWHGHATWGGREPDRVQTLRNKLRTIDWYIKEFSTQQQSERLPKLQASRKKIEEELAGLNSAPGNIEKQTPNHYQSTVVPVVPSSTPDNINAIVDEITQSIDDYNSRVPPQSRKAE